MMTRRNLIIAGLLLAVLFVGVIMLPGFGDDADDPVTVGLDTVSVPADALPSDIDDVLGDPVRYVVGEADTTDAEDASDADTDADDSSEPENGDEPDSGDDASSGVIGYADLRVIWWNDTVDTASTGAHVSMGYAVWDPDTDADSVRGLLKDVEVGQIVMLVVFPDGPDGIRIEVPLLLTPDMNPASDEDAVHVEVSDASVRVLGNPVDNFDVTFDRF